MQKTEEPTRRRLLRARAEGDVPVSPVLVRAGALLGVLLVGAAGARAVANRFEERFRAALTAPDAASASSLVSDVAALSLPALGAAAGFALLLSLAQTGGLFSLGRLVSGPGRRRGRLFGPDRASTALLGAISAAAVLGVGLHVISSEGASLANVLGDRERGPMAAGAFTTRLAWSAFAVLAAAAALDVVLRRKSWLERLRMTRSEVKQERRQAEGDPAIQAARRKAHEGLAHEGEGGASGD